MPVTLIAVSGERNDPPTRSNNNIGVSVSQAAVPSEDSPRVARVCDLNTFESDIQKDLGVKEWKKIKGEIKENFDWFIYPFDMKKMLYAGRRTFETVEGEKRVLYDFSFELSHIDPVDVQIAIGNFRGTHDWGKGIKVYNGFELAVQAEGKQAASYVRYNASGEVEAYWEWSSMRDNNIPNVALSHSAADDVSPPDGESEPMVKEVKSTPEISSINYCKEM